MTGPQAAMLGERLHLQHGPIDLIIQAWGGREDVLAAYTRARDAFDGLLEGLVADLPQLRDGRFRGKASTVVANRMVAAVTPYECFVTPMAAVAGAVADHILRSMVARGHALDKAMVNNGGDIALWLGAGQSATIGLTEQQDGAAHIRPVKVTALDGIGGIATSGWRGRSHSLGIADFVTVFAKDAATADVAATLIANAVDLPNSKNVTRRRANELSPDSDLGDRFVTVDVARLSMHDADLALENGRGIADEMIGRGLIAGALIGLQGHAISVGQATPLATLPADLRHGDISALTNIALPENEMTHGAI